MYFRYSTSGADIRDDTWHHIVVTMGMVSKFLWLDRKT